MWKVIAVGSLVTLSSATLAITAVVGEQISCRRIHEAIRIHDAGMPDTAPE